MLLRYISCGIINLLSILAKLSKAVGYQLFKQNEVRHEKEIPGVCELYA